MSVENIVKRLENAAAAYYNGQSVMDDDAYDRLVIKLRKLDPENDFLKRVGVKPDGDKVKHIIPMGSLDNAFSKKDIKRFLEKVGSGPIMLSAKVDGLSCELVYQDGKLVGASTRGDGEFGEDITNNVMKISNIPHEVGAKGQFVVRGEIVLPKQTFENMKEDYSNARNAASGIVRRKDGEHSEKLMFLAFDAGVQRNIYAKFELLQELGFGLPICDICPGDLSHIETLLSNLWAERLQVFYEMDGIVMHTMDYRAEQRLDMRDMRPLYAVAYKFPEQLYMTKLRKVTFQVGATGTITPVAHLRTVNIDGKEISRVNLCNEDEIERLGIQINDQVNVKLAGEVIPKIVGVASEGRNRKPIVFPTHCPACDEELSRVEGETALKCTDLMCREQCIRRVMKFVDTLNIMHLNRKIIEAMIGVDTDFDTACYGLYDFAQLDDASVRLAGLPLGNGVVGSSRATKVLSEIAKSRSNKVENVLGAIGITGLGPKKAKKIVEAFDLKCCMDMLFVKVEELAALSGFDTESAETIVSNVKLMETLCGELSGLDRYIVYDTGEKKGPLEGMTICITGTLSKPRKEYQKLIEKHGGTFEKGVSKKLDILLCGEKSGSKKAKAEKYGITIHTEETFAKYVGE